MKILITGAGGFIGGALAAQRRVDAADAETLCPSRAELDLTDGAAVAACLSRHRPDKIVHLAGALAKGEDAASRAAQWRDTFTAGRVLIEAAAAAGVPHLLIAGSVAELGNAGGVLRTDLPCAPESTYGLCKALLLECARFAARNAPVRVDWFRPFTVYGPGQSGAMMIPAAFAAAASGREAGFTEGSQRRDFLYLDDLIDWLRLALEILPAGRGEFHLHHLGSGTGTPVREVLEAIAAEFPGARFRPGAVPRRVGEPEAQIAPVPEGAEPPLNRWTPRIGWREGIARTAASWRTRSN